MLLFDTLQIDGSQREYTKEGFLKVPSRIARLGIQEYYAVEMGLKDKEPKEVIRVYRSENEVFSPNSMDSFANKPITNGHPPELVNSKNFKRYAVGFTGDSIRREGEYLVADLHITDQAAIDLVEKGEKLELSNGYESNIDFASGSTPKGEFYDAVQRDIMGNHVALVVQGRAGYACRVADNSLENGDSLNMAKITIDGVDFEVSEQAAQAVNKLQAELIDAKKDMSEKDACMKEKDEMMEKKEKDSKKTQDSLQAKLDDALGKVPSAESLDKMVKERCELIDSVRKVMPEIKFEGKDSAELIKEVVAAKCPTVNMDSVSEDYIKARFDMILESGESNLTTLDSAFAQQVKTNANKVEDARSPSEIAREKAIKDSREAWKGAK